MKMQWLTEKVDRALSKKKNEALSGASAVNSSLAFVTNGMSPSPKLSRGSTTTNSRNKEV